MPWAWPRNACSQVTVKVGIMGAGLRRSARLSPVHGPPPQQSSSETASWTAGCSVLSLHLLDLEPGFWLEPASPDHSLHVRLDRLGQVIRHSFDGRRHDPVLPATACFLPAGTPTAWRVAAGFRRLVIRLKSEFLQALVPEGQTWPARLSESIPAHDPVLDHYTGLVLHEAGRGGPPEIAFLDAFARLLGLHVVKRHVLPTVVPEPGPRLTPQLREKLDGYIRRTLPAPIVIEDLAAACELSHYQLLRLLKRATGETPQHYVLSQRVELARKLLRESELPLAEIADALGFSSQSHFSNTFKSFTHTTPKAYRERSDLI